MVAGPWSRDSRGSVSSETQQIELTPHRWSRYPRGQDRRQNPQMRTLAKNRLHLSARFGLMALVGSALALAGGTAAVRGQSALDGFDPNANGTVRVVVVQPDGKILIGGGLTTPLPKGGPVGAPHHISPLKPDRKPQNRFHPQTDKYCYFMTV